MRTILIILISVIASVAATALWLKSQGGTDAAKTETAYERVMRTGVLRCGYALYEPMLARDPNTGEMSGISADVIKAVADSLKLKIEWTQEFGFATAVTDIEENRFDVACISFWRLPNEARHLTYTIPFLYSQMKIFAREGDMRFDNNMDAINDPSVRIVSGDGQMSSTVARTDFPKARLIELPNMAPLSQQIEDVVSGKADLVTNEAGASLAYMRENPGKIREVPMPRPLRVFQNTFAMGIHENELKTMLDSALIDVIANGELDRILKKYDADGTMFKTPTPGYNP